MLNPEQPVLAQKYRLIGQLQAGGMGAVWLAEHIHLSSLVAVKLMGREVAATPAGMERFLLEARAAASLRSPHVVQILDYGVHEGTPFIAMELLEGESLGARLQRDGRFQSWEHAELILRQIARAVARAHDAGIVHRDLKPSNIFLVRNEEEEIVKLLDFGIAKTTSAKLHAAPGNHTRTGEFLGSPVYASPEQLQASKALDHRADIWSLGVLAFECFVGRPPFGSDTLAGLVLAICMSPLPVPSEQGPVPDGFDAWFARACARDVEQRFQSVREASRELRRLVAAATGGRVPASVPGQRFASGTERIPALPDSVPAVSAPPSSSPTDPTVRHPGRRLPADEVSEPLFSEPLFSDPLSSERPLLASGLAAPRLLPEASAPLALPWQLAAQRAEATRTGLGDGAGPGRQRSRVAPVLVGLLVLVPSLFALRALASRTSFDRSVLGLGPAVTQGEAASGVSAAPVAVPEPAPNQALNASAAAAEPDVPELGVNVAPIPNEVVPGEPSSALAASGEPPSALPPPAAALTPASSTPVSPTPASPTPAETAAAPAAAAPEAVVAPMVPNEAAPLPAQGAPKQPPPATAPASITSPPDAPRQPPARAAAPRLKQSRLTITASSTASVYLDGIPVGTTPIEDVAMAPGEHEVTFVRDGERSTQRVRLRDGEHKRVTFEPAPGDGLDEAAVQRTVRRYSPTVREDCWEATLRQRSSRGSQEPSSARVVATITVEPSGRVRSVATSGATDAYPELPYCIEDELRAWVFPSAPGETIVTVPFVFVNE